MKAAEINLAVAVGLCGLGSATAASAKLPGLAAFLAGAGGFLCSAWLLMRTL